MMATEPTVIDPASPAQVPAASSDPQLASSIHNVNRSTVTGSSQPDDIENKRIEDLANSAEASTSGGSDTEASRAGRKDGEKTAGRNVPSTKKQQTFKAVSVNKTFLASKAAAPSSAAKTGDRPWPSSNTPPPGSSSLSASKPRLVAKTGPQGSGPRMSPLSNGGKPASTPDPNVVWNKNRPVPPAEPIKMTDEDLKKYGIHMASRLDEDDIVGANKWADEEDDDDWAPETITWTDGTKTTLAHVEEPHMPTPAPATAAAPQQSAPVPSISAPGPRDPSVRVPLVLEKRTEPIVPVAPISASAPAPKPASGLPSGRGLKLKGAPQEKRTLVAKPPAPPQPSRSPWATIPPVERAPIAVEPVPAPRPPTIAAQQTPQPAAAPLPPKEIAADDFNRSAWRTGDSHSRELFNSQSGLYEPVADRRGSSRQSGPINQPQVLSRASHLDQPEPSSAFQTYRTSEGATGYGRRRGSSIVSGGSGSYLRTLQSNDGRMPSHAMSHMRRPSMAGSVDSQGYPGAMQIPGSQSRYNQQGPGFGPQSVSPRATFADPHYQNVHPGPGQPMGQAQPTAQPQAPSRSIEEDVEFQKKLMKERNELARKRRQEQEAAEEAAKRERIQRKLDAMGPAPEKKSDKLKASPIVTTATPAQIQIQQRESQDNMNDAQPPTMDQRNRRESSSRTAQAGTPIIPGANTPNTRPNLGPGIPNRRLSHGQETSQPDQWTGSGPRPDRVPSWSQGPPGQQPFRNVWASPNTERGLGNGTFNPELSRVAGSNLPTQASKGPEPIGPPMTTRQPSHDQLHNHNQPTPIGSRGQPPRYGQQPQSGADLANKWVNAVAEKDRQMHDARITHQIERERHLAERGLTIEESQPVIKDSWRPVHVPGDGTRRSMQPADTHQPVAWQPQGDERAAPRDTPAPHAGLINAGASPLLPQSSHGAAPSQLRSSRFFPAKEIRPESNAVQQSRPQSPSPPPPTMEDHPAYEGDVEHPNVSLPKPQAIVKLPPQAQQVQNLPTQPQKPPFSWAHPVYRDAVRAPTQVQARRGSSAEQEWQQRFDNLFSGKHSPPKPHHVDPASKFALDHCHIAQDPATVSLPSGVLSPDAQLASSNALRLANIGATTSKSMAEECFDEPEIGSLPQVRIPHNAPDAAWQPAMAPNKPLPKKLVVQAATTNIFVFSSDTAETGTIIHLKLPSMSTKKTVMLNTRSGSRGGRSGPRGRGHRGGARRETSSQETRESSTRSSHESGHRSHEGGETRGRGGRGGYRGRNSETWNRQAPTQSLQA